MDPGGDEFEKMLAAARAGAEWAVTALYRDMHPRLHRYLWAREPRAAEDLESEVWLAVAGALGRFVGGELAFRGWVFSIARRRLADYRRTAVRRATDPVPDDQLDGPSRDQTEGEALERVSAEEAAAFVSATLPHDQAEVILLRVIGGLDVDQVAEMLGKRPGTIRVLQHRGSRRLHEALAARTVTQ